MSLTSPRIDRRRFVAGAAALPAVGRLDCPPGGVFPGGDDRIRVGLVGCGGRGTGAAIHALCAAPNVTLTAMGDAFADQIASSAAWIAVRAGAAFDCPPERRFVGLEAWRRVVAADVDLVILASPPAFRPLQAAAAVAAGRHVWCETPGAVDAAGVRLLADAAATAETKGLCFGSGLAQRHDPVTAAIVDRARSTARPHAVSVHAVLGLPWLRPARPDWTAADCELRNWISRRRLSGGHVVEGHVAAVDKALWVLGDVDPAAAIPDPRSGGFRLMFHDGRSIDASLHRRLHATGAIDQRVRYGTFTRDLREPSSGSNHRADPLHVAMTRLVKAIRAGSRVDDAPWLCRATLAVVAGRTAVETGRSVTWSGLHGGTPSPA